MSSRHCFYKLKTSPKRRGPPYKQVHSGFRDAIRRLRYRAAAHVLYKVDIMMENENRNHPDLSFYPRDRTC